MGNLYRMSNAKTRSISPENLTGEKGKGGMTVSAEGTSGAAAREYGQGWKVNPWVPVEPGTTVTMADIQNEGEIKFYMDGDTEFPTICGTGEEDYFCGSYVYKFNWERPENNGTPAYEAFDGPYTGFHYFLDDAKKSYVVKVGQYRWNILDPIRFESDQYKVCDGSTTKKGINTNIFGTISLLLPIGISRNLIVRFLNYLQKTSL